MITGLLYKSQELLAINSVQTLAIVIVIVNVPI
jgi:hypothetical protein